MTISAPHLAVPSVVTERSKLTGAQIRAARALLDWTAEELAERALVGVATIRRAERVNGPVRCIGSITLAICDALALEGIEFTREAELIGVRLRR